jgi:endonuclease I
VHRLNWLKFFLMIMLTSVCVFAHAQVTVHLQDFATGLGTWSAVSVSDDADQWTAASGFAEINGFGDGDDEDWLISPSFNMDAQAGEYFIFQYNDNFAGPKLEIYYSTNYNGGGTAADVTNASWTQLSNRLSDIYATSCFSTFYHSHPAIDVSGISGTNVRFAFRYTGTASNAKHYRIDNVRLVADYYGGIASTLNCCALKTALHDLIDFQWTRIHYTSSTVYDVWDAMLQTDVRLNDAGTDTIMWDMFTDIPNGTGEYEFDPCDGRNVGAGSVCTICYEREHTFPSSWWGGGSTLSDSAYTDMHHLTPADGDLNGAKSNYPPGEVLTPTTTGANGVMIGTNSNYPCSSMRYFEPIDAYKGDYARMYFFMVTRYQHFMSSWHTISTQGDCAMNGDPCTGFEPWLVNVLLTWHQADPVSQKEIDRNNAVFALQGNRNPFIDHPTWVQKIWGDASGTICSNITLPVELISFDAVKGNNKIELAWSTASELNCSHFEIYKSSTGNDWSRIGQVNGSGNSTELRHYLFHDQIDQSGIVYYRLKQVDLNGEFSFSEIRSVLIEENSVIISPNPSKDVFEVRSGAVQYRVLLSDLQGRVLSDKIEIEHVTPYHSRVHAVSLPAGVYLCTVNEEVFQLVKE